MNKTNQKLDSRNLVTLLACLTIGSGCLGTEHLATMDQNTERLAKSAESLDVSTQKVTAEVEADREYIRILSEQMTSMATSLKNFEALATVMTTFISAQASPTSSPEPTADIDDILNSSASSSELTTDMDTDLATETKSVSPEMAIHVNSENGSQSNEQIVSNSDFLNLPSPIPETDPGEAVHEKNTIEKTTGVKSLDSQTNTPVNTSVNTNDALLTIASPTPSISPAATSASTSTGPTTGTTKVTTTDTVTTESTRTETL